LDLEAVICGKSPRSVLISVLFVINTIDIAALIQECGMVPHSQASAEETQVYGWSPSVCIVDLTDKFSAYFDTNSDWMR
jgi:hypothetical protein